MGLTSPAPKDSTFGDRVPGYILEPEFNLRRRLWRKYALVLLVSVTVVVVPAFMLIVSVPQSEIEFFTIQSSGYVTYGYILTLPHPGTFHFHWASSDSSNVTFTVDGFSYGPPYVVLYSAAGPAGSGTLSILANDQYSFGFVSWNSSPRPVSVAGTFQFTGPIL